MHAAALRFWNSHMYVYAWSIFYAMNCTLSRSTTSPCRKISSIIKITEVAYAWRFKKIFTFITCVHLQYLISINWTWTPGSPNLRFICPAFSLHMVCDTSVIDSRIMMFCWLASEVFILFWEFFLLVKSLCRPIYVLVWYIIIYCLPYL
jgi:hypothetical protein